MGSIRFRSTNYDITDVKIIDGVLFIYNNGKQVRNWDLFNSNIRIQVNGNCEYLNIFGDINISGNIREANINGITYCNGDIVSIVAPHGIIHGAVDPLEIKKTKARIDRSNRVTELSSKIRGIVGDTSAERKARLYLRDKNKYTIIKLSGHINSIESVDNRINLEVEFIGDILRLEQQGALRVIGRIGRCVTNKLCYFSLKPKRKSRNVRSMKDAVGV